MRRWLLLPLLLLAGCGAAHVHRDRLLGLGSTKLLGTESTFSSGAVETKTEAMFAVEYEATKTGIVEQLEMPTTTTSNTATKVRLGMFAEREPSEGDDNYPGKFLGEGTYEHSGSVPTSTTMTATVSVTIEKGKHYWLAELAVNGTLFYQKGTETTGFFHFFPAQTTLAAEEETVGSTPGVSGNPGEPNFAMKGIGVESGGSAKHKVVMMP